MAAKQTSNMAPNYGKGVLNEGDNFWSEKETDMTWSNSYTLTYNPSAAIDDNRWSFDINKLQSGNCIFLGDLLLSMNVKLVDKDGNKPADNSKVAPINAFPQTMIRSVRTFLNDTEVSSSDGGAYPLRAFTSYALDYGIAARWGYLELFGYFPDRGGTSQMGNDNTPGFTGRRQLFGNFKTEPGSKEVKFVYHGKTVPVYSKIFSDFSSMRLPMVPGVGCRLELALNPPEYYLFCKDANASTKKYQLKVTSVSLICPVKTLNAGLTLDLERKLQEKPINFPMKRIETKKIVVPSGQQSFTTDSLTQSSVNPDRMLMLFVAESFWTGGYGTNPLDSRGYVEKDAAKANITKAVLSINGIMINPEPAQMHEQLVAKEYKGMYEALGYLFSTDGPGTNLTLQDFRECYFMLFVDLSKDGRASDGTVRHLPKEGNLRFELGFDAALPQALNLFCLSEYNAAVQVDKNRNVQFNYLS